MRQHCKHFIGLFIGAAAFWVLVPTRVCAFMSVDPTGNFVTVPAGGAYAGKITVKNFSKQPLEVTSKVVDWKYEKHSGIKKFLPAGESIFSCASWITVAPAKFIIPVGGSQEVRFSVTAPAKASGGYYSQIDFSGLARAPEKKEGVNVDVALQMGAIVLVEIDKTQKPSFVVKEMTAVLPQADKPFDIKLRVKNEGNIRMEAKGRLAVTDLDGNAVGWTKFPDIKTLPGDEWTVTTPWDGPLQSGQYKMVATFELSNGGLLVEEKDLTVP